MEVPFVLNSEAKVVLGVQTREDSSMRLDFVRRDLVAHDGMRQPETLSGLEDCCDIPSGFLFPSFEERATLMSRHRVPDVCRNPLLERFRSHVRTFVGTPLAIQFPQNGNFWQSPFGKTRKVTRGKSFVEIKAATG